MFEGDFADSCANGGTSGLVKHAQMGSEDPHCREWIFKALPGNKTN